MIQLRSILNVADNSGARKLQCFHVMGGSYRKYAHIGDIIVCSVRDALLPVFCPLGADPGAMTAVRLSRLPGMFRHGSRGKDGKTVRYPRPHLQELAWLNPAAPVRPILEIVSENPRA